MPSKMREEFLKRKEAVATRGVVDTSPESINKQLEETFDILIDVHKEYVESEASEVYIACLNEWNDPSLTTREEFIYASTAVFHEGLAMFAKVKVINIKPTGIVEFLDPRDEKKILRLYADELMNYRVKAQIL
jgi:hypothetical protein